ncbi:MAG: DUF456 domain-containing protein [Verrucomicrobiae bacterium]|nr:DUF456 domain-containing protein [Verrucomicrobiae bacterium]MCB1087472.1 DUF456 domain-containing protein [Verrucomicrobiae bacterium]
MTLLAAIQDWFDWFPAGETVSVLKWILVIGMILVGFFGTFLPVLPGTTLIYVGMLAHYFLMGMQADSRLTWQSLVVIGLLWIGSIAVDWVSGAMGAKYFGSSKYGVWGALIGGLVGAVFFSLPGLILGPVVGVFVAEIWFAKKEWKPAANSTMGTVVGGLLGMVGKMLLAMLMIGWYAADVFVFNPAADVPSLEAPAHESIETPPGR